VTVKWQAMSLVRMHARIIASQTRAGRRYRLLTVNGENSA